MKESEYNKEMFEEMITDWQTDNAPKYDGLEIDDAEIDPNTGAWIAIARDEKCTYSLTDDGNGNIVINYLGSR